jgi:hypothetical protein
LEELSEQNRIIRELLDQWEHNTAQLEQHDDVNVRWERGSAAKLLLQHVAVREAAKRDIVAALRALGEDALADRLDGDGEARRAAIDRVDEKARGMQAINMNTPPVDKAVLALDAIVRSEVGTEDRDVIPAVRPLFGRSGQPELPGARSVRMRSATHPSRTGRWYEGIKPLQAVSALYDHLRSSPSGMTNPDVDSGREHTPGPRG